MVRGCYLLTLTRRTMPDASPALLDLVKADTDLEVRHTASRALGLGGLSAAAVSTLNAKLDRSERALGRGAGAPPRRIDRRCGARR